MVVRRPLAQSKQETMIASPGRWGAVGGKRRERPDSRAVLEVKLAGSSCG